MYNNNNNMICATVKSGNFVKNCSVTIRTFLPVWLTDASLQRSNKCETSSSLYSPLFLLLISTVFIFTDCEVRTLTDDGTDEYSSAQG